MPLWVSLIYFLTQRTLFVIFTGFTIMPFVLQAPLINYMRQFQASAIWFPVARLTYGAYLTHGIFMLFRGYNSEKGVFACEFDALLFFFAYLTFAFAFSFLITVFVEMPCHKLIQTYFTRSKRSLSDRVTEKFKSFTDPNKSGLEDDADLFDYSNRRKSALLFEE